MSELLRSLDRQIACVRREIGFRERVYPRQVASGKMSQAKADDEIAAMRDVLDTLETLEFYLAKRNHKS